MIGNTKNTQKTFGLVEIQSQSLYSTPHEVSRWTSGLGA